MNKARKGCSSCEHWIEWRELGTDGRGLCGVFDAAALAQRGKNCSSWAGKEYQRTFTVSFPEFG